MKVKKNHKLLSSLERRKEHELLLHHSGATEKRLRTRILRGFRLEHPRFWWQERKWWQKMLCILLATIMLVIGSAYGIARWYIASTAGQDHKFGATFSSDYAQYFGLDPQETMQAMISDLNLRHFRLVSYWDSIETSPGQYDFSNLDWQFKKVEAVRGTISLAIGLRQPRWPECHMPSWAKNEPKDVWYPQLKAVMQKVINRYKTSPALESYQLENEFFLTAFGECKDFSRDRLVDEFNPVKQLDPEHKVIISRSNNAWGVPIGQPQPDEFGISVYKRVWDRTITKRYFEYPFPAWFYAFLAGTGKIITGKDMIIHELQTEPWPPDQGILETPITEQNKSLNAQRLKDRIKYGRATGMTEIDLWGVETWYWRKVKLGDSSLWDAGREAIRQQQCTSCY